MSLNRNSLLALAAGALALTLSACGAAPMPLQARAMVHRTAVVQDVPPAQAFVTVKATVVQVLPADTSGLPHQNFVVSVNGQQMTVNNDTKYGSEVPGLRPGMQLTIKGVEYHDNGRNGIHWTHHADRNGDAGFIQTADGQIFQ